MATTEQQLKAGKEARDDAFSLLRTTRESVYNDAQAVALRVAKEQGYVTVDDVRERMEIPADVDKRALGAALAWHPDLEASGFVKTTVASSHARPIRKFRLRREG